MQQLPLHTSSSEFDWPIPAWLPGETLFSLLSRYHQLAGNRLASATCRMLFGHRQQGCEHDFPSRIDHLVARTGGMIGSADDLIRYHTILPFYLPFRPAHQALELFAALRSHHVSSLKFQLGLLTGRFRANHPLKACPRCISEDVDRYGVPYWHLQHQYPGVWICHCHQMLLRETNVKATGVGRFLWHLPKTTQLYPPHWKRPTASTAKALIQFALLIEDMMGLENGLHLDPFHLAATYKQSLIAKGLTTLSGRIRLGDTAHELVCAVESLRQVPELSAFPSTREVAVCQLSRLLGRPQTVTHPLRHLAIIYWLFGDWASFWSQYQKMTDEPVTPKPLQMEAELPHFEAPTRRDKLISKLEAGSSLSQAARELRIDFNTAATWASQVGFARQRRPKKLHVEVLKHLISDLRLGISKSEAADRYGLSISSINRVLFTEVGVHKDWHQARQAKAQEKARRSWTTTAASMPGVGVKLVRAQDPAVYAWLYRNDHVWLTEQCTKLLPAAATPTRSRLNWVERDNFLSQHVRAAGQAISTQHPGKRIKLWQLYQAVPQLKAKLDQLSRLPLTQQVILQLISKRRC